MRSDLRYALQRWRRRPGFAAGTVLTLALGIGTTTAIFSLVDAVLLRPPPWPEPERLVAIHAVIPDGRDDPVTAATWNRGMVTWLEWDALRDAAVFEGVAVWRRSPSIVTSGEERPEVVETLEVSSNFLPTLGVAPAVGRQFAREEDDAASDGVMVTHEAWQQRFAGQAVVGQPVVLQFTTPVGSSSSTARQTKIIVGILPPNVEFASERPEFLLPLGYAAQAGHAVGGDELRAIARLAQGSSLAAGTAAAGQILGARPSSGTVKARVVPLADDLRQGTARPLWLLFGGSSLVLLVACTNVAGLLLGEARSRRPEVSLRRALGASRAAITRQLLVEHALIGGTASVAGLLISGWLARAVVTIAPEGLPTAELVGLSLRIVLFGLSLGAVTLVTFGVLPALSLASTPGAGTGVQSWRDAGAGRHLGQRTGVVLTLALSVVLLVGASLFVETVLRLTAQPLGFDPAKIGIVATSYTGLRHVDSGTVIRRARAGGLTGRDVALALEREAVLAHALRTQEIVDALATVPGVTHSAGASGAPFQMTPRAVEIRIPGGRSGASARVKQQVVTQHYFETMRMPIVSGRSFTAADSAGPHLAVVSQEFERRFFRGDAVGRRFDHVLGEASIGYEVVGVVPDVKHRGFLDDTEPCFYTFHRQTYGVTHFLVRTSGNPTTLLPLVRSTIARVNPQVVVTTTDTMQRVIARSMAEEHLRAMLSALFSGAALVLAIVGLYALASRRVSERAREFGVRIALGAGPAAVGALVLRDAMVIVGLGLLIGLPGAFAVSQLTQTLLYGVSAAAPHVYLTVSAAVVVTSTVAAILPARRAGRLDPLTLLRE